MAQDSRPPGDLSVHSKSTPFSGANYRGQTWSGSYQSFKSVRPSYGKGSVVTLLGGRKFRKSTDYSHWSLETTANGPYSVQGYQNIGGKSGQFQWSRDSGREMFYPIVVYNSPSGVVPGSAITTNLRNQVVTKALLKLGGESAGIGSDLATFRQTTDLFVGKASILKDALLAAKRRKDFAPFLYKSAREILKQGIPETAAKLYLEWVYGVKPLMADYYGVKKLLESKSQAALLIYGRSSAREAITWSGSKKYQPGTYSQLEYSTENGIKKATCTLWAQADPNHMGLRALQQLGLINPLEIAWDLVSWSFVVDWFVPVGPVLSALTVPCGLIFVDGSLAYRTSMVQSGLYVNTTFAPDGIGLINAQVNPMTWNCTLEDYSRTSIRSWPLPGVWVNDDPFGGKHNDRQWKALALAIANIK